MSGLHGAYSQSLLIASGCHSERDGRRQTPKLVAFRLAMRPSCEGHIAIRVGRRRSSPCIFNLHAERRFGHDSPAKPTARYACVSRRRYGGEHGPNILFIMGDDIGWMQPRIYHRGLMVGETPNIDRIGNEGAIFMDYVAMQSCKSSSAAARSLAR
jgi:hypothetical protein